MSRLTQIATILPALVLASCQRREEQVLLIEMEQSPGLKAGANLKCRGVAVGQVESVTLTGSGQRPVAKVVLSADAPVLTNSDQFRICAVGLVGDPDLKVIPAITAGQPLPNGATVHAESEGLHLKDLKEAGEAVDGVKLLMELIHLPTDKRAEVQEKIRKLIDEAKKDSGNE